MDHSPQQSQGSVSEVFRAFLKLGLTSFGGPIAHLGYFRDELVTRRKWLSDSAYTDLVALCQFLPGPASSQVGFALDRKSVVSGKSGSVRVDIGGRRIIKQKKTIREETIV